MEVVKVMETMGRKVLDRRVAPKLPDRERMHGAPPDRAGEDRQGSEKEDGEENDPKTFHGTPHEAERRPTARVYVGPWTRALQAGGCRVIVKDVGCTPSMDADGRRRRQSSANSARSREPAVDAAAYTRSLSSHQTSVRP